ncbi:TetR/AcrR family transcriptional regulator [Actinokineospora sp. NPDC004072]
MTTPRATRRAQTTQESRRLLITAAAELFAERGYRQTTFEDIAARSGVSRGSIPWHFGNKEGLLAAVVDDATAALRAEADNPVAALDQVLARIAELTSRPSTRLFTTLAAEAAEPGSPLGKWCRELHAALRELVRAWVARAELADGLGADELSAIVLGVVMGVHQQWRTDPAAVDLDRTYAAFGVLLRAVGRWGVR